MASSYTMHTWWAFILILILAFKKKYASNIKALCLPFGYLLFCVGMYLVAFAKGKYECTPLPPWEKCIEKDNKWTRSRMQPGSELNYDQTPIWTKVSEECPPQDCKIKDTWGPWGPCISNNDSKLLGSKVRTRVRELDVEPQAGGKTCDQVYPKDQLIQTQSCDSSSEHFRYFYKRKTIDQDPAFGGGVAALVFACILITLGHLDPPVFLPTIKLIGLYVFSIVSLIVGYYYLGYSDGLNECDSNQYSEDTPINKVGIAFTIIGVFFLIITHLLALPLTESTKK